uniref:Aprataxin n=1 Tax=Eptatretus burgeri TaxID=7764 RepID=A0A8C4QYS5_EPTBU
MSMSSAQRVCLLRCGAGVRDAIALAHGDTRIIGRGPDTKITDKRCSRQQVLLKADCIKECVRVTQLGVNPTSVDSTVVGKNGEALLKTEQTLYIVNNQYPYTVQFEPQPSDHMSPSKDRSSSKLCKRSSSSSAHSRPEKMSKQTALQTDVDHKKQVGGWNTYNSAADSKQNRSSNSTGPGHWSQGLLASMHDPTLQVYNDNRVVAIRDKYPKARQHWLILPWQTVHSLRDVRREHVPLLRHMQEVGKQLIKDEEEAQHLQFRLGYHVVPSMSHLHLHVISQDFDSPSLKTKKHWNSFNTEYFIDAEDVLKMLEEKGRIKTRPDAAELLKATMKCHICLEHMPTIPKMKEHIATHQELEEGSVSS